MEAFSQALPGTLHVITRYRSTNSNLRTQLQRIIRRAGLTPWPRLFHNLRATRQTELAELFPGHVVCAWIGNTERVAQNHYLQVTDEHFAVAGGEPPTTTMTQAAQIAAQCAVVSVGIGEEATSGTDKNRSDFPSDSEEYNSLQHPEVAAAGLEPATRGL